METSNTSQWCIACRILTGDNPCVGGFIYSDEYWTINHVLPPVHILGHLVLQPRRHIEVLHQLSFEEAGVLGQLLSRTDKAIRQAVGAEKVYVCLFAESPNCPHLHFHLIPRKPGMSTIGPEIFNYRAPEPFSDDEVAGLVQQLRGFMS